MSQENVEVIRRLLPGPDVDVAQALRDDDLWAAASKAWAAVVHPDFECVLDWEAQRSNYVGVDGIREAWLEWVGPWERYFTEIEELIDAGDSVVAFVRDHARRKGVDGEIDQVAANVSVFRDGKILRIEFHASRAKALEAVGL
jgi:ketosteroid isomerase-like protein